MTTALSRLMNGLKPEQDTFFATRPDDPQMRESTSLWLFEESGAFAFPRMGIEAEACSWERRRVQANVALTGGRVLNGAGQGVAHPVCDEHGRPVILGAGPLAFRCLEPFRRWQVTYDGDAADGTVQQQITGGFGSGPRTTLRLDAELEMVTPAWVQDNSAEKVASMSEADAIEAANMGIGWRFEQLFRARGVLQLDGRQRSFNGVGLRIKRQSVRPLAGFRGHCWQSAVFPDGRAFGYIAYPPREDGRAYNAGYLFYEGKMHHARVSVIPWLRRIVDEGDDVSLQFKCATLGTVAIRGRTTLSTFRVGNPDIGGLNLQQGGAYYEWDGYSALGMIERSAHESLTSVG